MGFQPVTDERFILAEAPHWDEARQELLWVDIAGCKAYGYQPGSDSLRHWTFDEPVSAIAPRAGGRDFVGRDLNRHYVIAAGRGAYDMDPASGALTPIAEPSEELSGNRSNEARVDPCGRFWLSTMENNIGPNAEDLPVSESTGMLWCIDTDGSLRQVETGVGISNSLVWSPDLMRMYFADTLKSVIWVYDWDADSGRPSNRRVFAATEGYGNPDGSAMDEEGCLWNARWGAGCIIRYRPDGSIDRIVDVPAQRPSSCVFGGEDRRTLYVTTAYFGMSAAERGKFDGALLAAETDVIGQVCSDFAG